MDNIGIVGVGAMGRALLERLKSAGVEVTAYDSHGPSLEAAGAMGARTAATAAAVAAAAAIVDVVVRSDQDVLDCMCGKDGVLEGARAGTLVLLHPTILPQTTQRVAEAARRSGVHVLDACMVGVPGEVRRGNLSFLVGGPESLVERARPHLLRMGKQLLHMGPLGAGNTAKIIKNLVTGAETLVIHEAIQIGEAAGLRYTDALEMMRKVYSGTLLNRWQGRFDRSGKGPTPTAGYNLFGKDLQLAERLTRQYGLDLPITAQLAAAARRLARAKPPDGAAG